MKTQNYLRICLILTLAHFGLVTAQANDATGAAFQTARERVAKLLANSQTQNQPVPLLLRAAHSPQPREPDPWWRSWVGGSKVQSSQERTKIEVVARLSGDEEHVIDQFDAVAITAIPTITDKSGSVVGYFRVWQTQEDSWTSARGEFAIYLASSHGVAKRVGEVRCQMLASEGSPAVGFSNGQWDAEAREIEFDLRSSCTHVDLYGGKSGNRTFNMLTANFLYDASFNKNYKFSDHGQRLVMSVDDLGSLLDFETAKANASERKAFRTCTADAVKEGFRICSSAGRTLAFWKSKGRSIEFESECTASTTSSTVSDAEYIAIACDWPYVENNKFHVLRLEIVAQGAPEAVIIALSCTCSMIRANRLHFDMAQRALSFNLDTDADEIEFEGDQLKITGTGSSTPGEETKLPVQVFTVKLNENWQVVQISDAATSLRPTAPKPVSKSSAVDTATTPH
jgi:hypothetical protein